MAKVQPEFVYAEDVPLTRLHLDTNNPRHDPIEDEDRIIAQLCASEKVFEVARDIAAKGGINPLDRIGVIELEGTPGHYIVVEGNRRTCALKLLHDPRKAPHPKAQSAFESLRDNAHLITRVPLVVFRDRSTAEPWLRLRHLGEQSGVGTRPWSTAAKNRFAKGATPDRLALDVLERALLAGWIDAKQRGTIAVTTLRRYLGNPVVRAALGISSPSELLFTHDVDEVDRALKRFVFDALPDESGKAKLHSRSDAKEWREYGQSLHSSGLAPTTPLSAPYVPPPADPDAKSKKPRNPKSRDSGRYVVTSEFVVKHADKNLHRILRELRTLSPDDAPFAVNYLVRAAIERIMVLYAQKHRFFKPKMPDHMLIQHCVTQLTSDGVPATQLKAMRVAGSNLDATYSLDTLGSAVHVAQLPTRKGLIAVWDNWEPCLKLMIQGL